MTRDRSAARLRARGACLAAVLILGAGVACDPAPRREVSSQQVVPAVRGSAQAHQPMLHPAALEAARTPGVSLTWLRDAALDGSERLGRVSAESGSEPVDDQTRFAAGRLGQPILAFLLLQLVDAGQFDLDQPLADWIDVTTLTDDPRSFRLTARHILAETSGLHEDPRGVLEFAADPGERFYRTAHGYRLLQSVLESLTGRSLASLAEERVFRPLGMSQSTFAGRYEPSISIVAGLDAEGRTLSVSTPSVDVNRSLWTTSEDYARFLAAVLRGWGLSERNYDFWLAPQVRVEESKGSGGLDWALGWGLERSGADTLVWSWGDESGCTAFAIVSRRSGDGFVLLTNSSTGLSLVRGLQRKLLGRDSFAIDWAGYRSIEDPAFAARLSWMSLAIHADTPTILEAIDLSRVEFPNAVDATLVHEFADVLVARDRLDTAREILARCIQWFPGSAASFARLGDLELALGDLDQSLLRYRRAAQLAPRVRRYGLAVDWLALARDRAQSPIQLNRRQLRRCAGRYGRQHIAVERDVLVWRAPGEAPLPLIAIDESRFFSPLRPETRLVFTGDPSRRADGLRFESFPRRRSDRSSVGP